MEINFGDKLALCRVRRALDMKFVVILRCRFIIERRRLIGRRFFCSEG